MNHEEKLNTDAAGKALPRVTQESIPKDAAVSEIAYQNKDVSAKVIAEQMPGKDFSVLGVSLPKIVSAHPTNLPAVEANELRMDNLFLLEDGSYLLVDYESKYSEANKYKYLNYLARLAKRLYNLTGRYAPMRILIIYTADVSRDSTEPDLDLCGVRMHITEAFLTELDGDRILNDTEARLRNKETLSGREQILLGISPLTYKGKRAKVKATHRAIMIADMLDDIETECFVMALIKSVTNKFISKEDADLIKEAIEMTKVDRLFEKEKREAVMKAVNEVEARAEQEKAVTAQNFLRKGVSIDNVAECTGLPIEKVQELAAAIA